MTLELVGRVIATMIGLGIIGVGVPLILFGAGLMIWGPP